MLPKFPEFKKLELSDKEEIEKITSQFPPYSDFNFTSMWCWDTKNEAGISVINDNLVIRLSDYISGEPLYSLLGNNSIKEAIDILMAFIKSEGLNQSLRLVPEHSISDAKIDPFVVLEDRDNFDYIYSLEKLCAYKGNEFEQQRNLKNRFTKKYEGIEEISLDLSRECNRKIVRKINEQWQENKCYRLDNEEDAMTRLLFPTNDFHLVSTAVLVKGEPVAFSISECLSKGFAISHFAKANTSYSGVYSYLMYATANLLASRNCAMLNYEQDLGIAGLRYSKTSYRPVCFLKKYVIQSNGG